MTASDGDNEGLPPAALLRSFLANAEPPMNRILAAVDNIISVFIIIS
jgi:hypothetical protein